MGSGAWECSTTPWLRQPALSMEDEPRYVPTLRGRDDLRRAIADDNLFGPWPRLSEVLAREQGPQICLLTIARHSPD
jgi:hypothetical protein